MAVHEAILAIKVISDSTQAAAGLDKTAGSAGKFKRGLDKMVVPAAAVAVAIGAIGKQALDAASDLEQAGGAVESVFGKQADAVKKLSQDSAKNMGISAAAYQNYAALVGTALQNAGLSVKDSVTESNKLIQRGADLAATFGGTTADAVDAINAAVSRSEFDPLEKYGVSLNMTAVNAKLAAKGQDKLKGKQLDAAKKAIVLEEIYSKSAKAQGQYAKEADSAAGSAQTAAAQWTNAAAALGEALLPAASAVASTLAEVAEWMQENSTVAKIVITVIGAVAVAILVLAAALKIAALANAVMNATWLANPIVLIVLGVIAVVLILVGVIRLLWKHSETFRKVVTAVWSAIKAGAKSTAATIKRVWSAIWEAASATVQKVKTAWRTMVEAVKGFVSGLLDRVRTIFGNIKDAATNKIQAIKDKWDEKIEAIKTKVSGLGTVLKKPFEAVKTAIDAVKTAIDKVIDSIASLVKKFSGIHFPDNPFSRSGTQSATAGVVPSPTGLGAFAAPSVSGRTTTTAGGGVVIQISGALDPEAVARQIERLLGGHGRRIGRSPG
jgi:hypothetical protein